MKKNHLKINLFFMLLFFTTSIIAQKQVTGTVTSKDGPLPGVTVLVKGTTNGTSTDFDGNYTISNVESDAVLVFSFIGFKTQEIEVDNRDVIDISLEEDAASLDEVVVVGYGTKKRSELTSSVAQVKGSEIKESPAVNYATSLSGRLPGLFINQRTSDPGQESLNILIRGRGTFGDNSVLVVVDGVVGRDGLSRLDPQDIETISVLKDASASVYGARAANGVILVTTKRGQKGGAVITVNSSTSLSNPTTVTKGATPYNYARQVNAIRERSGQQALYTSGELQQFQSGNFNGIDFWNELFDETSFEQRHNLSVRGGSDNIKYFGSIGLVDQGPIVNNDNVTDFSQYNVRSNVDFSPSKNLTIGLDLAGRLEYVKSPPYMFQAVDNASKVIPLNESYQSDGKFIRLLNNQDNPFAYIQEQAGKVKRTNTLYNGTLKLNYDIPFLEGLSFNSWVAIDYTQNYVNSFNNNPFQYITEADGTLTESRLGLDISVSDEYFRQLSLTYNAKLGYQHSFGSHTVETFIAYEQNKTNNNANSLSRRGGLISEDLPYLSQGDPNTQTTNSALGELARQAYIGRLSYDYEGKYLTSFGFRYDGSYIFPKGKRFGFFPYASAGWVLSKEKFLAGNKTLSFLKLRGTWGVTGNDRVSPFQYLQRFQNPSQGGGVFYLSPNADNNSAIPLEGTNLLILSPVGVDPNPNITWETATSWDLGLETRLFSDQVSLELTYFSEKREDILAKRNVTIPTYTGLNPPSENIGKTKNHGFEAAMGYNFNIGKVRFDLGGNFSYAQNELVFNDSPKPEEDYQILEGQPIGSRLIYDAIGIYRSQSDFDTFPSRPGSQIGDLIYADTNNDGEITTADRIIMKKSDLPTTQYGISLKGSYKNFELSTFWQGQSGSVLSLASFLNEGTSSANYFAENAWTPDTPNASLPSIGGTQSAFNGYTNYENNFFTYNTSFFRLKNVQLGYRVPENSISKLGIKSLRIYLSGSNLLTFSKFNKLDFADVEQTNGLGYNRPLRKLYNLGIELSF
ncbi:TonB-dependent receptor [Aureibaculum sp. 2210JD6-5]|uniref:SusC/RagA family TonB-linked outer membrane protein n=1 Tax=Aureibaculum sp. 2210JD6-5 TaxID=3103957 RepID=UPI002AAF00FD|nr:TonB-dependent receptor [Aureibaculum sp. 2210JD6-5]MDY7396073.1 TonB-dependent receptor [Aureibaculum sp. 2210JD6-5]